MISQCRVRCAVALGQLTFLGFTPAKNSFIAAHHFKAHTVFSVAILTLHVMLRSFYVILFLRTM